MNIKELSDLLDDKLKPILDRIDKIESSLKNVEGDMKKVLAFVS